MASGLHLSAVQVFEGGSCSVADWQLQKAEIVKWAIVAGVFVIFFIWFVAGYYHAKRRVKKGLKPLPYHKVRKT